jgi:hypothetical protein
MTQGDSARYFDPTPANFAFLEEISHRDACFTSIVAEERVLPRLTSVPTRKSVQEACLGYLTKFRKGLMYACPSGKMKVSYWQRGAAMLPAASSVGNSHQWVESLGGNCCLHHSPAGVSTPRNRIRITEKNWLPAS